MAATGFKYKGLTHFTGAEAPCAAETLDVVESIGSLIAEVEFSEVYVRVDGKDMLLYITAVERDTQGDIILHATTQE